MVYVRITKPINSRRFKVNNILTFGHKYIYSDDERSKYNMMYDGMIKDLLRNVLIVASMTIFTYVLLGTIPFYLIIFDNVRVPVLGLEILFCELDSDIGYAMNLMVQSILGIISFLALMILGFSVGFACHNIFAIPEVIQFELQEFENEFHLNGDCLIAKMRLRNALMKVQDFTG